MEEWMRRVLTKKHVPILAVGLVLALAAAFVWTRSSTDATAVAELVSADNQFGFRLFRELVKGNEKKNVLLSGASVATSLDMVYNGASGAVKEAMGATLGLGGMSEDYVNRSNGRLFDGIDGSDPKVRLLTANSVWTGEKSPIKPAFLARVRRYYQADAVSLDLSDPATPARMNSWVKKKTNGRISDLVKAPPGNGRLVLLNAMYFKGEWSSKFDKTDTRDEPFYLADGTAKVVPMMHQSGPFEHAEDGDVHALRIPYGNGRFSMYVFLCPDVTAFAKSLNEKDFRSWVGRFRKGDTVSLALPRFSVRNEVDLKPPLEALGMRPAFEGMDFDAMVEGGGGWISSVRHGAFVEVNEQGTEAAAATSTQNSWGALGFSVKMPFLFVIRDDKTGLILFMGQIMDPAPDSPVLRR